MTLKEYIRNLNNLVKENPGALDLEVIYSIDDEGNAFHKVHIEPTIGYLDEDGGFKSIEQFEDWDRDDSDVNSVCIN